MEFREMNGVEGVLLTGGASRRMGTDKAGLPVEGRSLALKIAEELRKACEPVTVLGRRPLQGFEFLLDEDEFQGPMAALARFAPTQPYVFVASCDLPLFESSVVQDLAARIEGYDAAIPDLGGRLQPLCALYRREAFDRLRDLREKGEQRIMRWIDGLDIVTVPGWEATRNVNTPEEWSSLSQDLDGEDHRR
ncbi:MAG TPA: molybdenum cofactor guanylyltransferase [Fimbriimonas sp.]